MRGVENVPADTARPIYVGNVPRWSFRRQRAPAGDPPQGIISLTPGAENLILRRFEEQRQLLSRYAAASPRIEDCMEAISRDAGVTVEAIADLARPFDPLHVLTVVRILELAHDPNTFRESTHEGSVASVELISLIVAASGGSDATFPDDDVPLLSAAHQIVDLASLLFRLEAVRNLVAMTVDGSPLGLVASNARAKEIYFRNPTHDHIAREMLAGLFGSAEVEQVCLDRLGFTVRDACAVFDAVGRIEERAFALYRAGRAEMEQNPSAFLARVGGRLRRLISKAVARGEHDAQRRQFEALIAEVAAASAFDVVELAAEVDLGLDTVEAVVDCFAYRDTRGGPIEAAQQFFESQSPLRMRPLLWSGDGKMALPHGVNGIHCIRERIETALKSAANSGVDPEGWHTYSVHRANYLELRSVELLAELLSAEDIHRNIRYFVPAENTEEAAAGPASYTKRVETDALLLADDIAIVVEAKAGWLRPDARSGDPTLLRQDLSKLITHAAEQAERLRQRISANGGLRLHDDTWLDLSYVREVHLVAATLEDTSGIVTATSDLIDHALLREDAIPWTVSLQDLRVISEIVQRPAEFVLYLRRRTDPATTRINYSLDELDLFMEFLTTGLYVEPDPDQRYAEMPLLGPPDEGVRERYGQQVPRFLFSRTDDLDAWFAYRYGRREAPAERPALPIDPTVAGVVDHLALRKSPGWLNIGATLLSYATDEQEQFGAAIRRLRQRTAEDSQLHSFTIAAGDHSDRSHVIALASLPGAFASEDDQERFATYVLLKKHQLQCAFGAAIVFGTSDALRPVGGVYDNSAPGPDRELDALVEQAGLKSIEEMHHTNLNQRPGSKERV